MLPWKIKLNKEHLELNDLNKKLKKKEENLINAQKIAKLGSWEWNSKDNMVTVSDEVLDILKVDYNTNRFKPEFFAEFIDMVDFTTMSESISKFSKW